jgi:hypothetical protein
MATMTISQALRRINKLKGELKDLDERAAASVSYQEGIAPAFNFRACTEEHGSVTKELITIEAAVAHANAVTDVNYGGGKMSLAYAVRQLHNLRGRIKWFKDLDVKTQEKTAVSLTQYDDDHKRVTIKVEYVCELPEAKRANVVKGLQQQFDAINELVEQINHKTSISIEV